MGRRIGVTPARAVVLPFALCAQDTYRAVIIAECDKDNSGAIEFEGPSRALTAHRASASGAGPGSDTGLAPPGPGTGLGHREGAVSLGVGA